MTNCPIPERGQKIVKVSWDASVELGSNTKRFPDGRSVVVEAWAEDGYTFNTYFFSTMGIEDYTPSALISYMREQGVPLKEGLTADGVGLMKYVDDSGNELWSVMVAVGEPEW